MSKGKSTRQYLVNKVTVMPAVRCPHCSAPHDPKGLRVDHTYPNGNRRHMCPACKLPFVSRFNRISATV